MSAACSSSGTSALPSHCDRPMLSVTLRSGCTCRQSWRSTHARRRSQNSSPCSCDRPGRISANSSPPMRATRSRRAALAAHQRRDLVQHLVADRMPEAIVDDLEVIEIADRDAERMPDRERHFHLGGQPLREVAAIGETGQRILLRFALELQAPLAQRRDQPLLLRARLLQLVRPLGDTHLQPHSIVLEIFERTRVRDCRRHLRGELLHEMQVRLRVHARRRVLHAEQARHRRRSRSAARRSPSRSPCRSTPRAGAARPARATNPR